MDFNKSKIILKSTLKRVNISQLIFNYSKIFKFKNAKKILKNFYCHYWFISFLLIGRKNLLEFIVQDHKNCCLIIDRINSNTKYMFFLLYYFSVPFIDLLIILSTLEEVNTLNRFLKHLITVVTIIVLLIFNYTLSSVLKGADSPYNKINSIIVRNKIELNLKLKVCGLIEKLAGPVIGFYCVHFSPTLIMNFISSQLIVSLFLSYFLI